MVDRLALLSRHSLLRLLPENELAQLADLCHVKSFANGAPIFMKGDAGESMMIVVEGRILISSTSVEGKEIVLNIIDEGEVFGEIALLDGKSRTADASAMEQTELLVVDRRHFLPILERNPRIAIELLSVLCDRIRNTSEQVEDTAFRDLNSRLAKKLHSFAEVYGRPDADGSIRIGLKLTQGGLGAMMGTSRESINKHLRAWVEEGIIDVRRGRIVVRDKAGLEAQFEAD